MRVSELTTNQDFATVRETIAKKVQPSDLLTGQLNQTSSFPSFGKPINISNPSIKYFGSFSAHKINANSPKALFWTSVRIDLSEPENRTKVKVTMRLYWLYFTVNYFFIALGLLYIIPTFIETGQLKDLVPGLAILTLGIALTLFHRYRIKNATEYFLKDLKTSSNKR